MKQILQTTLLVFLVVLVIATVYILLYNQNVKAQNTTGQHHLNITRTLFLQVNSTGIGPENRDEIRDYDYTLTMHVKGNRYNEQIIKPLDQILENRIVKIPIINNEEQEDDGSDFRIDVWVNNYENKYKKVNYPIKFNSSFESVDITDMLNYAIDDTQEERAEEDPEDNDEKENRVYSLIKDRKDDDNDKRPHAKIKDPKDYDTKLGEDFDQPSVSGTKFLSGTNASDINWGEVNNNVSSKNN